MSLGAKNATEMSNPIQTCSLPGAGDGAGAGTGTGAGTGEGTGTGLGPGRRISYSLFCLQTYKKNGAIKIRSDPNV